MVIQNNCKDMIKKSADLQKTCSQAVLKGFLRKSFGATTLFALSLIFFTAASCVGHAANVESTNFPERGRTMIPIQENSFETSSALVSIAQEPLFLDNRDEFSIELRPFLGGKNYDSCFQSGSVLTLRKQWEGRYISGQLLGAKNHFVHENSRDIIAALTYGQRFLGQFAGALTLFSTWTDSKINFYGIHVSPPKAWSLGLSPMLVYYMEAKVPLDLFLGGDIYYGHKPAFDGYDFKAKNDVLWRVKFGPSYTMKREGRHRLYQLKFALAANLQSQIPDRFIAAPSIFFESQPLELRGGYLFKLDFNLGEKKKSWSLSYGLRF